MLYKYKTRNKTLTIAIMPSSIILCNKWTKTGNSLTCVEKVTLIQSGSNLNIKSQLKKLVLHFTAY